MPLIVFICVLDHGKYDNKDQWRKHCGLTLGYRNDLNHLHEHDDEKVKIGKLGRELLEQIVGHKGPPGILRSSHTVISHIMPLAKSVQGSFLEIYLANPRSPVIEQIASEGI